METADEQIDQAHVDDLDASLQRLDARLLCALESRTLRPGHIESFRGLYLNEEDICTEIDVPAGTPTLDGSQEAPLTVVGSDASGIAWLARAYHLTEADLDVLLIAIAPEIDLRYERAYGFLQDDVTKKRPTVDLALNLLACSARDKRELRRRFSTDAPLRRFRLIQLADDPGRPGSPLLAKRIDVDPQVLKLMLGEYSLDDRLQHCCENIRPELLADLLETDKPLPELDGVQSGDRLKVNLFGPDATNSMAVASSLANCLSMQLLVLDARSLSPDTAAIVFPIVFREAWFANAVLLIRGVNSEPGSAMFNRLLGEEFDKDGGVTLIESGRDALPWSFSVAGLQRIELPLPTAAQRLALWHDGLDVFEDQPDDARSRALAEDFKLTTQEIRQLTSATVARCTGHPDSVVGEVALRLAQELVNSALKLLTNHIEPTYTWDDIVLPDATRKNLERICHRITHRYKVLEEWGFGEKLSLGKGTNALFSGPSGTGKTMAAEVVANELKMPLFRIDLATVVNKYIGETEKNLKKIFDAAERASAVLFFDEADALFGKRSEVKDSHDRYANIEISYLLQMMEQYRGLSILATNLRGNLDDAFLRRLAFVVHFTVPETESRIAIWERTWPDSAPVKNGAMARILESVPLTGGQIKNMALGAAYLAATGDERVDHSHFIESLVAEYQKMGKQVKADDRIFADLNSDHDS